MAKIKRTMTVSLEEFGKQAGEYALDEFEYNGLTIRQWADKITSGEYQPVKHGRWIDNGMVYTCSECNSSVPKNIFVIGCDFDGCPYCFARMDGDKDNNVRNLTDEETAIYENWIESEAKDTGINIMEGDSK